MISSRAGRPSIVILAARSSAGATSDGPLHALAVAAERLGHVGVLAGQVARS